MKLAGGSFRGRPHRLPSRLQGTDITSAFECVTSLLLIAVGQSACKLPFRTERDSVHSYEY